MSTKANEIQKKFFIKQKSLYDAYIQELCTIQQALMLVNKHIVNAGDWNSYFSTIQQECTNKVKSIAAINSAQQKNELLVMLTDPDNHIRQLAELKGELLEINKKIETL